MMEATVFITVFDLMGTFHPVIAGGVQQRERSDQVGFDKSARPGNRIVDMAFGGKVNHAADIVCFKQPINRSGITNITLHKLVVRRFFAFFQIVQIAGISQFVQIDYQIIRIFFRQIRHKVCPDKSGAAGY